MGAIPGALYSPEGRVEQGNYVLTDEVEKRLQAIQQGEFWRGLWLEWWHKYLNGELAVHLHFRV